MSAGLGYFLIFVWISTIIFTIVLAVKKGYNGFLAFLLGLFIPLLGSTIIIGLLPDNNVRKSYPSDNTHRPMNLSSVSPIGAKDGETWTCKKCGEKNRITASSCSGCGTYK